MENKIDKEKLNELLRQKLSNEDETKALSLRQPPASLLNQQGNSSSASETNNDDKNDSKNKEDK